MIELINSYFAEANNKLQIAQLALEAGDFYLAENTLRGLRSMERLFHMRMSEIGNHVISLEREIHQKRKESVTDKGKS